uniref:Anticodon-binding domain-containing protein n=1 Tax=Coccolithus braarudii TaxID=221442 RepID=A0A7S0LV79_9EUKA|mmetsp:Transcript_7826/g.17103  ORF Transcript_7826/g.17103 Transcript_7826/m.17103 type:complete len:287 (+) Transcript_7826:21-881(+)|eukprot:CAMPEP_0183343110 /NCGR_PEP_ID=MMETSP0164_2-20130417/9085_1 /TAXON_ID=221442 /ORGANISM="Coccolithus pelagicus ssp braarudi, Strain PLY182g" /LENGTH=286 /DNA_ID=CAMNT_0025513863 /DNA_START=17 /DNA_END=877 /DNA_ORIENTATION=-
MGDATAEELRKERQREMQRLAREKRAQGEAYAPKKKKRKPLERRKFDARSVDGKKDTKKARHKQQKESKKAKAAAARLAPELVIVPIFWKGVASQRAKVLSACADVEALLKKAGKAVIVDGGTKYTPGQKFAHWEHRGVRLRIELGPHEAEKGCCTVARTFIAGDVAKRVGDVRVEEEALLYRIQQLSELKEEGELSVKEDGLAEDGGSGDVRPEASASTSNHVSGDSLDDDFALADESLEVKPVRGKAKRKAGQTASAVPSEQATPGAGSAAKKRDPKRIKVVQF